jgi:hypothetical protein
MSQKKLEAWLCSPPEREDMVVQLFFVEGAQWGEVREESQTLQLEIFASKSEKPMLFDLEELLNVLILAKEKLSNIRPIL